MTPPLDQPPLHNLVSCPHRGRAAGFIPRYAAPTHCTLNPELSTLAPKPKPHTSLSGVPPGPHSGLQRDVLNLSRNRIVHRGYGLSRNGTIHSLWGSTTSNTGEFQRIRLRKGSQNPTGFPRNLLCARRKIISDVLGVEGYLAHM